MLAVSKKTDGQAKALDRLNYIAIFYNQSTSFPCIMFVNEGSRATIANKCVSIILLRVECQDAGVPGRDADGVDERAPSEPRPVCTVGR
jgi:hypothetical protein